MKELEAWTLSYLLNSLWQVPLVLVAAWVTARLARQIGARSEHRVWVGALLLEAALPACHFQLGDLWRGFLGLALWSFGNGSAGAGTRIVIGPAAAYGSGLLRLPAELLVGITAIYGCTLLYFAGRLAWGLGRTQAMLRQADRVILTNDTARAWEQCCSLFRITPESAEIAVSPRVSGPVTVGILKRVVLVPAGFLERVTAADLKIVLAHEFAHLVRRDFEKNLLYRLLSLPAAYHPALWLTGSRIAETREILCDAMAAEAAGRESYARALLRLATMLSDPIPAGTLHAIGFFDANIFERRVMSLTRKQMEARGVRRFAIVAACGVIALATCASTLALHEEVSAPPPSQNPQRINVKADNLKIIQKVPPVYPVEAKATKNTLNGSVVLRVIIGKDGEPENIKVTKGLRADYDASALQAVRQWRWQPYLLNGNPIEVITTVNIVYLLEK